MTEDVIMCCLARAIAHLKGQWYMSVEQWWNNDNQRKTEEIRGRIYISATMNSRQPISLISSLILSSNIRSGLRSGFFHSHTLAKIVLSFPRAFMFRINQLQFITPIILILFGEYRSQDISVGTATGYKPDGRGSTSVRARDLSLVYSVQTGYWAHPASYPMGTGGSVPGGKAAEAWSWLLNSI
jgi:hypothetical protein